MRGSTTRKTSTSAPFGRICETRACVATWENSEPSTASSIFIASPLPRTQELQFAGQLGTFFVVLLSAVICDWGHRPVRQMSYTQGIDAVVFACVKRTKTMQRWRAEQGA